MTKNEAAKLLTIQGLKIGSEIENRPDYNKLSEEEAHTILSEALLDYLVQELGMLPPTQKPSLINLDDGTQKHGPSMRIWDK